MLHGLVDGGNTVIVIEHHFDVLASCDWLIDMGPVGGEDGGRVMGMGTPEEIAALKANKTAQFLRPILRRSSGLTEHA